MRATVLSLSLAILIASAGQTQERELQENAKTFMRAKLSHSQNVLEGLAIEDFGQIAKGAQEMSLLSLATQWQVIQTPEYVQRSAEFRREVDALKEAGQERNLDGATLAFLKVTLNCVECHKYVRQIRHVGLRN